jgi:hypothetical protein
MESRNPNIQRRVRRVLQRLGTDKPICCCCPESHPACLELHHIAGKAFGKDVVIICRNCHRKLSDSQEDHPTKLSAEPVAEERIAHFLLGLADLLKFIADKLREFGFQLLHFENPNPIGG